jgi:hypothetical protein
MLGAVSGGVTLILNIVRIGHDLKLLRIPIETVCGDLIIIVLRPCLCFLQSKRKAPHVDALFSLSMT